MPQVGNAGGPRSGDFYTDGRRGRAPKTADSFRTRLYRPCAEKPVRVTPVLPTRDVLVQ